MQLPTAPVSFDQSFISLQQAKASFAYIVSSCHTYLADLACPPRAEPAWLSAPKPCRGSCQPSWHDYATVSLQGPRIPPQVCSTPLRWPLQGGCPHLNVQAAMQQDQLLPSWLPPS